MMQICIIWRVRAAERKITSSKGQKKRRNTGFLRSCEACPHEADTCHLGQFQDLAGVFVHDLVAHFVGEGEGGIGVQSVT